MHILRARIGGVDARGVGTGVPIVDDRVKLHPGVATFPSRLRDIFEQLPSVILVGHLATFDEFSLP